MPEPVLARIARGDSAAVAQCLDEFGPLVWSLAQRFSPTHADAEDAVQEIFMDVWKAGARFDPQRGSERAFVATIARRRLIDRSRRAAAQPQLASSDELETIAGAAAGIGGETSSEAEHVAQAFAQLPAEQQRVIELSVLHGLSHSEIARHTGLPLGSVKTHLRRGILRVRDTLGIRAASDARGSA
ncbi:MAG TPA: sigma-70 family RNA polymerase sigma factor [Steroidobacteraceae bacterium]|nr:sigma-70 family RNA polymerase sigma factor [Steroidobacteraceae bacterium]